MGVLIIILGILLAILIIALIHLVVDKVTNNDVNINIDKKKYDIVKIKSTYMFDKYSYDKINIDVNKLIAQEMLNEIIKYIKFKDEVIGIRSGILFVVDRNNNV